jgi:acyl-coenzyme A thioesterase PaaI-like protein
MDVISLPFNRLIGLEAGSPESGFLLSLPAGVQYTNHLGTVHASALFAVAEAASGVFLVTEGGLRV